MKHSAGMHANLLRALERIGHLTAGSEIARTSGWQLIDAGVGMRQFNLALPTALKADTTPAIAVASDWFRERGTEFSLMLREPGDEPLIAAARELGFALVEREPSMLLRPIPPPDDLPAGLSVHMVRTADDVARYGTVDGESWHELTLGIARTVSAFPDFTMLLGELDGVAVATSMAVVTGNVVGVYNVQTRTEARGRGIGRAMTLAAIDAGRAAGCTMASLQSTPAGLSVYRRLGFERVNDYVVLDSPARS